MAAPSSILKFSNPTARSSWLSSRLDAWCKNTNQLQHDLEQHPEISWTTSRQTSLPLWVEMFCGSMAPLSPMSRPDAWAIWLRARAERVDECAGLWSPLGQGDLLSPPLSNLLSPAPARTASVALSWRFLLASIDSPDTDVSKLNASVAASWVDQQKKISPSLCNPFVGLFIESAFGSTENVEKHWPWSWWDTHHDVMFAGQTPELRNVGLVSLVEVTFFHWMMALTQQNPDAQRREEHFWKACHQRCVGFGLDHKTIGLNQFALPSFHAICAKMSKFAARQGSGPEFSAHMQKIALCMDVGCWPWLTPEQTPGRTSGKKRM